MQNPVPDFVLDDVRASRERYLDRLVELMPKEVFDEERGPEVTIDGVLRAFRDEVLVDLTQRPVGRAMIGSAVGVALRARWSKAGVFGEPAEKLRVDDGMVEDLETLAAILLDEVDAELERAGLSPAQDDDRGA